jgi:hypothetical protein
MTFKSVTVSAVRSTSVIVSCAPEGGIRTPCFALNASLPAHAASPGTVTTRPLTASTVTPVRANVARFTLQVWTS